MKVKKITRVYLTIEVEEPWGDRSWAERGREKRDAVARLIGASGIDNLSSVDWHVESPEVCSFCGEELEEDEDGPMCCVAAQDEHRSALEVKP